MRSSRGRAPTTTRARRGRSAETENRRLFVSVGKTSAFTRTRDWMLVRKIPETTGKRPRLIHLLATARAVASFCRRDPARGTGEGVWAADVPPRTPPISCARRCRTGTEAFPGRCARPRATARRGDSASRRQICDGMRRRKGREGTATVRAGRVDDREAVGSVEGTRTRGTPRETSLTTRAPRASRRGARLAVARPPRARVAPRRDGGEALERSRREWRSLPSSSGGA